MWGFLQYYQAIFYTLQSWSPMESQPFFLPKCGDFCHIIRQFLYSPELEPRALPPMEVFSATATFSKKTDRKKLPGEEKQWEAGDEPKEQ